jgi:hypothetical protein
MEEKSSDSRERKGKGKKDALLSLQAKKSFGRCPTIIIGEQAQCCCATTLRAASLSTL